MNRLVGLLRPHAVTLVAVVLTALVVGPTSAYAVATIRSADIVDGEVKAVDLGNNAVRSPKILDRSIANADLGTGAVTGDKVADGSLGGNDIADNTLSGLDVNESTLATVPSARQAGLGRSDPTGSCDPESSTFMACSTAQITLDQPGRLFVIGTVQASPELSADNFYGSCQINTTQGPIESSRDSVDGVDGNDYIDSLTVHTITDVFPAGTAYIWIECNEGFRGAVHYYQARISVVGLSAG